MIGRIDSICWCDKQDVPRCTPYDATAFDAVRMIRTKYLSAVAGPSWWPICLAPYDLANVQVGWHYTLATWFLPVYFEDRLVALLLARGEPNA